MKLSRRFLPLQLIFVGAWVALTVPCVQAQDRVVTKDGRVQNVKVVGANPSMIQVQVGANILPIPMANIAQIVMAPPPEYTAGVAAFQKKDYVTAIVSIKGVAEKFKGLPLDWARSAASMLGDVYLAINDVAKAEAAYKEFQQIYPGVGGLATEVGMARIALAKNDVESAKKALEPIAEKALQEKNPSRELVPIYGQAFFVLAQIKEKEGDLAGAFESYLRTSTIFAADRMLASAAQEKADALRQTNKITVP